MDLSQLSDADLMALKANDLSKMSDQGLMALKGGQTATPQAQPARQVPEIPQWKSAIVGAGKGIVDPALALAQ